MVELGTHSGFSFFAFCQAVKNLRLETHCFAVDTWMGDEHTGFYDETVFEGVKARQQQCYSASSRLIRCTFDEAVSQFESGSIDLLHIDGAHKYEDVKHDFYVWNDKLSKRGVILFHDTNETKSGFGVRSVMVRTPKRLSPF